MNADGAVELGRTDVEASSNLEGELRAEAPRELKVRPKRRSHRTVEYQEYVGWLSKRKMPRK